MRDPETKTMERGVAHVWTAEPIPAARVLHLLDADERHRLTRFRFERDANSFASAHALTRLALSGAKPHILPSAWSFRTAEFGKPELSFPSELRFNLSHTRGLVAAATLVGAEVGVDVEAIGTREVAEELRERVLSPLESETLDALATHQQAERFFSIWALKESYIKARGLGLRLPLKEISFAFHRRSRASLSETPRADADAPADWKVHLQRLGEPTHALGVTAGRVDGGGPEIHVTHVDLATLAQSAR
ncbi:4'-phosphopantetheinyl transferase sfp [Planctomycetes bacterium Poly30]|uniref:4'-phosphopantetheinyl transferase sfp n=1 Tax=Saltatorellus ferox TaxID=2528018 RepID=A0A518F1A2_9BACT|nr:4'-phosphopantetheinyl transferase sfp [Planctomycetes bacterium Poly30]